jgi:hypothetical protein
VTWSEDDLLAGSPAFVELNRDRLPSITPKRLVPARRELDDEPVSSRRRGRAAEEKFADRVMVLARSHGWRVQHVMASRSPARVTERGEPDLRCWHPSRGFFAAELKVSLASSATGFQLRTLAEWAMAGLEVHVWTPDDWDFIEWRFGPAGCRQEFSVLGDEVAARLAARFDV